MKWLDRMLDRMEADTVKVKADIQATWAKTDAGRAGIPRKSVSVWQRYVQVARAAYQGRYR